MKFAAVALLVANVSSASVSSEETAKAVSLLKQVSHDATLGDLGKALTAGCNSGDWMNLCDKPIAEYSHAAEDSHMSGFCDTHCPTRYEHRALLARGQPHQSLLQNDLEALATSDCLGVFCK